MNHTICTQALSTCTLTLREPSTLREPQQHHQASSVVGGSCSLEHDRSMQDRSTMVDRRVQESTFNCQKRPTMVDNVVTQEAFAGDPVSDSCIQTLLSNGDSMRSRQPSPSMGRHATSEQPLMSSHALGPFGDAVFPWRHFSRFACLAVGNLGISCPIHHHVGAREVRRYRYPDSRHAAPP